MNASETPLALAPTPSDATAQQTVSKPEARGTMKKPKARTFTDQIRKAVLAARKRGWSRYAIARAAGISEGSLGSFVAGKWGVSSDVLDKIAPLIGLWLCVDTPERLPTAKARGAAAPRKTNAKKAAKPKPAPTAETKTEAK